jgi:hypothetical protein
MKYKYLSTAFFVLVFSFISRAQNTWHSNLSFLDDSGNQIILNDNSHCPAFLDSSFWKREFLQSRFNAGREKTRAKFLYTITDIKKLGNSKMYVVRIFCMKQDPTLEQLLSAGSCSYRMHIKKRKGVYSIASFQFIAAEI